MGECSDFCLDRSVPNDKRRIWARRTGKRGRRGRSLGLRAARGGQAAKGGGETGARASGREDLTTTSEPPRGQAEAHVPPACAVPVTGDVGRRSQCSLEREGTRPVNSSNVTCLLILFLFACAPLPLGHRGVCTLSRPGLVLSPRFSSDTNKHFSRDDATARTAEAGELTGPLAPCRQGRWQHPRTPWGAGCLLSGPVTGSPPSTVPVFLISQEVP